MKEVQTMRADKIKNYAADIREEMLTVIDRVYWNNAPELKQFPYAVFEIRAAGERRTTIEIDLWGTKGNETELWDSADELEADLDGFIINNQHHTSSIISNHDKTWVKDDDERLVRINLSFNATYQA